MKNAVDNQIHLSQSVPMSSPLTWMLTGDIGGGTRSIIYSFSPNIFRVKSD